MNNTLRKISWLCLLAVGAFAGCPRQPATNETPSAATSPTAAPSVDATTTAAKQYDPEKICLICAAGGNPMEGEELPESLEFKGQTYRFCKEECKAEFISDPAKYKALSSR